MILRVSKKDFRELKQFWSMNQDLKYVTIQQDTL